MASNERPFLRAQRSIPAGGKSPMRAFHSSTARRVFSFAGKGPTCGTLTATLDRVRRLVGPGDSRVCASRSRPRTRLAYAVDADGVHLGRDDASIANARRQLGPAAIIGASCYDSLERAGEAVEAGADYIAFGSFYASTVKPEAPRVKPSLLTAAKARWNVAVVAIGGITPACAAPLITAGADALAVITAVFEASDVEAAARAFAEAFARPTLAAPRI
jgi:Thiamine monophosphate synthase